MLEQKIVRWCLLGTLYLTVGLCAQEAYRHDQEDVDIVKNIKLQSMIQSHISSTHAPSATHPCNYRDHKTSRLSCFGILVMIDALIVTYMYIRNLPIESNYFLVHDHYPYAAQWYTHISLKYPQAHFEQKHFLGNSFFGYMAIKNSIIFDEKVIQNINTLYQRKLQAGNGSQAQQHYLPLHEWILLHEAGHIEHKDYLSNIVGAKIIGCGLESLYQFYGRQLGIYAPSKNILVNLGIPTFMFSTQYILSAMYKRYQEIQADAFANKYADDEALVQGKKFFQLYQQYDTDDDRQNIHDYGLLGNIMNYYKIVYDLEHPFVQYRMQAIDDEIQQRWIKNQNICLQNDNMNNHNKGT